MMRKIIFLVCFLIAWTSAVERCSFEFVSQDDTDAFVSFGYPDCAYHGVPPKSVEMWIKPLQNGGTFNEGIIFDSGLFTNEDGNLMSYTLSIKSDGQLFGVITEKEDGQMKETISASNDHAIPVNAWTHIIWVPLSNKFFLNTTLSSKATINGKALIGISNFHASPTIKIGLSFHGRISLVRLWDFEISSAQEHASETLSCELKKKLVAYWDFSDCKQVQIQDFTGNACGYPYPSEEHFLWYNMDAPTVFDNTSRFHQKCNMNAVCNDQCKCEDDACTEIFTEERYEPNDKSHIIVVYGYLIIGLATLILFNIILITIICCCCCGKKQQPVEYNRVELQEEPLSHFQPSSSNNLSPVYIKN